MTDTRLADTPSDLATSAHRRTGLITLAALLSAGWATNHFAALLPVLEDHEHITKPGLDAAFGLYALGLLPSLLLGGGVSDRVGRRPVVLTGLALACAGNLVMLIWPTLAGVVIGRLVVGLGVGMVASAGTAWAADQDAAKGAARAGVTLTSGFAIGPVATALVALGMPGRPGIVASYAIPVLLTLTCVTLILLWTAAEQWVGRGEHHGAHPEEERDPPFDDGRRNGPALIAALPMGLWVFACVISSVMIFTGRIGDRFGGPLLIAVACVLALGAGVLTQVATRRWGHWRPLGVIGAGLATLGFVIGAAAGAEMSLVVFVLTALILGCAYGLCLGQGLQDVERLAPRRTRGLITGMFYVVSYSGFALPFVLNTYEDQLGPSAPLVVLAVLAALTAVARWVGIVRGGQATAA